VSTLKLHKRLMDKGAGGGGGGGHAGMLHVRKLVAGGTGGRHDGSGGGQDLHCMWNCGRHSGACPVRVSCAKCTVVFEVVDS
jgi:hypothetical protein